MHVAGAISFGIIALMLLACAPQMYRYWLGRPSNFDWFDEQPDRLSLGPTGWSVCRRVLPGVGLIGIPFLVSTITFMAAGGVATRVGSIAQVGLFAAAIAGLPIMVSLVLWNRPRALVPPHLRAEPGLIGELQRREG